MVGFEFALFWLKIFRWNKAKMPISISCTTPLHLGEPKTLFSDIVPLPRQRVAPPRRSTGSLRQTNLLGRLCFLAFSLLGLLSFLIKPKRIGYINT